MKVIITKVKENKIYTEKKWVLSLRYQALLDTVSHFSIEIVDCFKMEYVVSEKWDETKF